MENTNTNTTILHQEKLELTELLKLIQRTATKMDEATTIQQNMNMSVKRGIKYIKIFKHCRYFYYSNYIIQLVITSLYINILCSILKIIYIHFQLFSFKQDLIHAITNFCYYESKCVTFNMLLNHCLKKLFAQLNLLRQKLISLKYIDL